MVQPADEAKAKSTTEAILSVIKIKESEQKELRNCLMGIKELRFLVIEDYASAKMFYTQKIAEFDKQIAELKARLKESKALKVELRRLAKSLNQR